MTGRIAKNSITTPKFISGEEFKKSEDEFLGLRERSENDALMSKWKSEVQHVALTGPENRLRITFEGLFADCTDYMRENLWPSALKQFSFWIATGVHESAAKRCEVRRALRIHQEYLGKVTK